MKDKKFIKKAEYPGGNTALKEFLDSNIKYPRQALERRIEGRVFLKYEVSNNGIIQNIGIIKGLGYGCDEEAVRLVGLLKYGGLNNKGCKVNTKF
ncbi:MAG: TonB family protein, partial [Bacteroidota bacterium]|nr:TonB family protein [Bacteroidota bacterium]